MVKEVSLIPNRRRVLIPVGILLLVILTSVLLVQSLFAAGDNSEAGLFDKSVSYYQDEDGQGPDVITSTQDFERTIDDYIEAHILSDEERLAMGLEKVGALDYTVHFPTLYVPLNPAALSVSRPNSSNHWTLSWMPQAGQEGQPFVYHLEEAQQADFSDAVVIYEGPATEFPVTNHLPSVYNVYYYRLRNSVGSVTSDWSNSLRVVGGYRDDFNNRKPPWKIRRTTHIDEVKSWYEPFHPTKPTWLIMQANDSWDWGITSGLQEAPTPPYVIEYSAKMVSPNNLNSFGVVFGGDLKEGEPCPDWSSTSSAYGHTNCFNQFYNTNFIYFGDVKLLFERVDRVVWCPRDGCSGGGAQSKRDADTKLKESVSNVSSDNWNTWRVEVRDSGIDVFGNGRHILTYDDTRYIHNPYFGFFGSTDEYSGSTTRYEYIQIMPLDN